MGDWNKTVVSERSEIEILRESVRHLSQAFSVFDDELKLVFWNDLYGEMLKFPPEMLYKGAPMEDFFRLNAERGYYGDGDVEEHVKARVAYVRKNRPHSFRRRANDGRVIDVQGSPLPGGGVVTTYSDVTEQVQLEDKLSIARAQHELASRISHTGHWKYEIATGELTWSDEVYRIHGMPVGAGITLEKAILTYHPDDRESVSELVHKAFSEAIPFEYEKRVVRSGGEVRHCHVRGFCETSDDGTSTALFGTTQDVTARVAAETARLESERRYLLLYQNSPAMLWTSDEDFKLKEFNERFATQIGYSKEEIIGKRVLDFCTEESRQKVMVALRPRLLTDGHYSNEQITFIRKDGTFLEVEITAYLDGELNNGNFQTLAAALDITARNEAERRLRVALEEAEMANRTKSQFLANISHELRTPLNSIIGFSQFMSQQLLGPIGNPQYLEYSKDILYSGEHLLNLINDILDITKIEAGETRIEESVFSIADVIESCMRMVRQRARAKGLVLRIQDVRSADILVRADERLLKQILINLLTNAIKFTEAGEVTVSAGFEGKDVYIEVTDTGVGIPPEDQERVLLPFVQIADAMTRNHEGSGLGLPLSKSLIELHGGRLQLESAVGEGTVIRVFLPPERLVTAPEFRDR